MVISRPLLIALLLGSTSLVHALEIKSESGVVIEAATGKILWSKNPEVSRFPASTTKIMTAILLIENCKLDEVIEAPKDIAKVKEASMHLKPGEKVKMKDMLYAIMLRSANDGCYAVAVHIAGTVDKFSEMMNERAKKIGCRNTHFHNPNGLNDPLHTTTALDLALMAREGMKYPLFREVVKTFRKQINRSENWADTWMTSKNKLLKKDLTADGVKTGYTVPAGHCYVGSATREGRQLITCILKGDKEWEKDHLALLDYGFSTFERKEALPKDVRALNAALSGSTISVAPTEAVFVTVKKGEIPSFQTSFEPSRDAKADAPVGTVVGKLSVRDADGFVTTAPAKIVGDNKEKSAPVTKKDSGSKLSWLFFGGLLVGGLSLMRGKAKRLSSLG
jgi:D-alanyl-D-alanine carboxypeptidase